MTIRRSFFTMQQLRVGFASLVLSLTTACAVMPATLTAALVAFCQDVLLSAAQNFTPDYAETAGGVFLALAEAATGQPFTQLPEGGIAQVQQTEGGSSEEAASAAPAAEGGYETGGYDSGGYADEYPGEARSVPAEKLALEVAILAQRRGADGKVYLEPVSDGDVLKRGAAGPESGDKMKFFVRTNCECYVYIVNVDATAWITQIYPPRDATPAPVSAGSDHVVPEGRLWWGLDEYTGVETIYFVLSRTRLEQLEASLAELPESRPEISSDFRPVAEAGLLPSRGLVPVEDVAPTTVATEQGERQEINPLGFTTQGNESQMIVTRWFNHE